MITEHARDAAPVARRAVRTGVQDFLRRHRELIDSSDDARRFLADARRYLPGPLADQIERSLAERFAFEEPQESIDAFVPDDD